MFWLEPLSIWRIMEVSPYTLWRLTLSSAHLPRATLSAREWFQTWPCTDVALKGPVLVVNWLRTQCLCLCEDNRKGVRKERDWGCGPAEEGLLVCTRPGSNPQHCGWVRRGKEWIERLTDHNQSLLSVETTLHGLAACYTRVPVLYREGLWYVHCIKHARACTCRHTQTHTNATNIPCYYSGWYF